MRTLVLLAALAACACDPVSQAGGPPQYTYEIVHTYRHDPSAYTQGLLYLDAMALLTSPSLHFIPGRRQQSEADVCRLEMFGIRVRYVVE